MKTVLEDFSAPTLAAAIRDLMVEGYEYLGRSPAAACYDSADLKWVLTGVSTCGLNVVLKTRFSPNDADARIKAIIADFETREVGEFSWWNDPDAQPADLGERLVAHGFVYPEGMPGMAVDLATLQPEPVSPSDLTIEVVRDKATLRQWVEPFYRGFGGHAGFGGHDVRDTTVALFDGLGYELPLRSYLGWLDGQPVATSQLFLGTGVAGIYSVATTPEARGQGIGRAMTLAPLLEARTLGYQQGVLVASPMGEKVYRRLGFQEYCQVRNYLWLGKKNVV